MKVIVAGGRDIEDSWLIWGTIARFKEQYGITEIVSGACPTGVDAQGEACAEYFGLPVKKFPADWKIYGKRAGPVRNSEMADYADALILVWNGNSRGSGSMKHEMEKRSKLIKEVIVGENQKRYPHQEVWHITEEECRQLEEMLAEKPKSVKSV